MKIVKFFYVKVFWVWEGKKRRWFDRNCRLGLFYSRHQQQQHRLSYYATLFFIYLYISTYIIVFRFLTRVFFFFFSCNKSFITESWLGVGGTDGISLGRLHDFDGSDLSWLTVECFGFFYQS